MANSLKKGTKKVKVDGGNPAAIKGSEYSRCNGDEPGTAGGVKSSTNMKEATWLLYSFDVKIEGKNACRLSDKMMMNHGNTACLGGTIHAPVPVLGGCEQSDLDKLACECNKAINNEPKDGGPCPKGKPWGNAKSNPGGSDCTTLGTKKHTCCELSIKEHAKKKGCDLEAEKPYPEGAAANAKEQAEQAYAKKMKYYRSRKRPDGSRMHSDARARGYCRRDKVYRNALYKAGAKCIADVVDNSKIPPIIYDFKFNCGEEGEWGRNQKKNYKTYADCDDPVMIHKNGENCDEDCK
jgi:uncharacterized Zn-binding protein involved in type VI secretion